MRSSEAWKKADTDGDGFISPAEFAAMERISQLPEERRNEIFQRLDKNGDGLIGSDELPPPPERGMQPLEEVDADKDGRIVFEEFQKLEFVSKLPEERQRELFKRMDRDGDGAITPKDRPEGPPRGRGGPGGPGGPPPDFVKLLDKDGDGSLTLEEFREAPFLRGRTEEEIKARFDELDRNKDLKIDASEFRPHFPSGPPHGAPPRPAGPPAESDDAPPQP